MKILVTGASGFVGGHLVRYLLEQHHEVIGLSRNGTGEVLPGLTWAAGDVVTGEGLLGAMSGAQAVIHLVGIIREGGESETFDKVHVEGTRQVLAATAKSGLKRYLHMSALGAVQGSPSGYLGTKAKAEAMVKQSTLDWTIFKPSLIFGEGDDFFGHVLKDLVTAAPVIPQIGDGHFLFRPVWIGDVVRAFAQALEQPATIHQTYTLVGPTEYSFRELLLLMKKVLDINKPIVPVPLALMKLGIPLLQILPKPPITKDQFLMLLAGNTGDPGEAQAAFDLVMETLPNKLPMILSPDGS